MGIRDELPVFPRHVGIIMDGNGRWAKKRGLPRSAGHVAGAKVFKKIALYAAEIGLECLTVYAFSTENWSRPAEEVSALMRLFKVYLHDAIDNFSDRDICVRFLGDSSAFPKELRDLESYVARNSAGRQGMTLNIAMNYGGRAEITRACRELARAVERGKLRPDEIDEKRISALLYTAGEPDPDLIIRPSGEKRISNFLLWQSAYAEFVYNDILWPDYTTRDLDDALREYARRSRRFGGVK